MSTQTSLPAFNAFDAQVKTLCLKEFPCGIGTWRENHKERKPVKKKSKDSNKFTNTLNDFGANREKTETLKELVTAKRSPWNLDYSWSEEAKDLREIAVRSPWLIDEKFVLSHFKTLRIIDKKVSEVDAEFLKFPNLTELTLSANNLRTVNSENLPKSLKVLELCANQISHLADLCIHPPPLLHLGLGHNLLTMVDDYITGDYWPELLSLDLAYNNLCDLMDIVKKLQTLPKLRNVVLQGNPLSLVPGYRGYVIDSLRNLHFLDDISISADEKHHYKGLAKRKEYILDEAKIHFHVDFVKGILQPEELNNPEDQPEFPIITRNYYVQFMFLEDKSANAEIFQLLHDDQYSSVGPHTDAFTEDAQTLNTQRESLAPPPTDRHGSLKSYISNKHASEALGSTARSIMATVERDGNTPTAHPNEIQNQTQDASMLSQSLLSVEDAAHLEESPAIRLAPLKTNSSTWCDEMELNWTQSVVRDDLLSLRDFINNGMDIAVIEEKILSYPADQFQDGVLTPSKDKLKGDKKDKKDEKKKDDKDDGKKKKKKGEPDIEMTHLPAEYTSIAEFHVPLEQFLEGDYEFENVYIMSWTDRLGTESPLSDVTSSSKDKKDKKKAEKKKDDKPKEKDARGKSPKSDRKTGDKDKDKGKGKGSDKDPGEEEPPPPPPPLEVHMKLRLHHWRTAMDSIKEEEDRLQEQKIREEIAQNPQK